MLGQPRIERSNAGPIAVLHLTVPRAEIQRVMGPGLQELLAAVSAQGAAPAGPWFTHHLRMRPDVFDFEIGVPLAAPISASGRVAPSSFPAALMVRAIYQGPYEGLASAWGELDAWIAAQGLEVGTDLWECYVAGPEASPAPANFRTELSRPLAR